MEKVFESTPDVADVNASMQHLYQLRRFKVDVNKAELRGASVHDILRNLDLAMGKAHSGDIKQGNTQEPIWIVTGVPYGERSDPNQMADLPIPSSLGGTVPLGELGHFEDMGKSGPVVIACRG